MPYGLRSIGQVLSVLKADFPDVSISKIRFLESEGLLTPERAPSGYRRYSDEDITRLSETCFGITAADDIGYAIAQSLVLEIGGEPFRVREDARTLYHAALAHAGNHVITVVLDAVEALRDALAGQELLGQELVTGDPAGIAERILAPLARASSRAIRMSPCQVCPGGGGVSGPAGEKARAATLSVLIGAVRLR